MQRMILMFLFRIVASTKTQPAEEHPRPVRHARQEPLQPAPFAGPDLQVVLHPERVVHEAVLRALVLRDALEVAGGLCEQVAEVRVLLLRAHLLHRARLAGGADAHGHHRQQPPPAPHRDRGRWPARLDERTRRPEALHLNTAQ